LAKLADPRRRCAAELELPDVQLRQLLADLVAEPRVDEPRAIGVLERVLGSEAHLAASRQHHQVCLALRSLLGDDVRIWLGGHGRTVSSIWPGAPRRVERDDGIPARHQLYGSAALPSHPEPR